ncbi:unnamed protein product [Merluccius merluccius]
MERCGEAWWLGCAEPKAAPLTKPWEPHAHACSTHGDYKVALVTVTLRHSKRCHHTTLRSATATPGATCIELI